MGIVVARHSPSGRKRRILGACRTCMEVFWNGVRIGSMGHTTENHQNWTQQDLRMARTAWFAAARGTTRRRTAGPRSGAGASRPPGTIAWASALPAGPSKSKKAQPRKEADRAKGGAALSRRISRRSVPREYRGLFFIHDFIDLHFSSILNKVFGCRYECSKFRLPAARKTRLC